MKWIVLIIFSLWGELLAGQHLTPVVMVSGGGFYSNGKISLSSTIGQAYSTILSSGYKRSLIQGFAPSVNVIASPIKKTENSLVDISVFPNPAVNILNIDIKGVSKSNYQVEMYDIYGRQLAIKSSNSSHQYNERITLDLTEISAGQYLIRLVAAEKNEKAFTFKILKNSNL